MKNSSTCPKCSGAEVKKNTIGWMQNMALGEIYRCTKCGYSEIWNTPRHRNEINALVLISILVAFGAIGYIFFGIYSM